MLRDYEILYIVRPDRDEDQLGEAVKQVTILIENLGGTHQKSDPWGKRRLAYEVAHLREGHYVLTDFQLEPARVPELEATLKISEDVFRHLVVRKPEKALKNAAPAAAAAPVHQAAAEPAVAEAEEAEAPGAAEAEADQEEQP